MFSDPQVQMLLEPELEPGERILWCCRPDPKRMLTSSLPAFFFGLVWTAFIVNFIAMWYGVGHRNVSGPGGLFGFHGLLINLFFLPFILIGLAMLLSPLWAYSAALRTVYAITNKRILIVKAGKTRTVQSYGQADIGTIERKERADGTGDLTFAQNEYRDSDGDRRIRNVQFQGITDVRSVESLLRDTFQKTA